MGISKYHIRATHIIHSALACCNILKYLLLNLVPNHSGLRGDFGHPNILMVSKVILLQGFNIILSVTYLGQNITF